MIQRAERPVTSAMRSKSPVVVEHHRVVFEGGGCDQEIGDRPTVLSPPGQLVLNRERTCCDRLGEVKPGKAQQVLTEGE